CFHAISIGDDLAGCKSPASDGVGTRQRISGRTWPRGWGRGRGWSHGSRRRRPRRKSFSLEADFIAIESRRGVETRWFSARGAKLRVGGNLVAARGTKHRRAGF